MPKSVVFPLLNLQFIDVTYGLRLKTTRNTRRSLGESTGTDTINLSMRKYTNPSLIALCETCICIFGNSIFLCKIGNAVERKFFSLSSILKHAIIHSFFLSIVIEFFMKLQRLFPFYFLNFLSTVAACLLRNS